MCSYCRTPLGVHLFKRTIEAKVGWLSCRPCANARGLGRCHCGPSYGEKGEIKLVPSPA